MFPWLMWWAPIFRFPFSHFNQQVAPETDWFLGTIKPGVGDPKVEREICQTAGSYGKQLGILIEVLLAIAKEHEDAVKELHAMEQLQELQKKVEKIKAQKSEDLREKAKQIFEELAQNDPEALAGLIKRYSS